MSIVGTAVGVPVTFVVAGWLGPTDYGRTQFVLLFYFFATLLRTGIFEGGVRAYIAHAAKGEQREARDAQNKAVSFEILVAALPGVAMALAALGLDDPLRRLGFYLAPLAVLAASVRTYFGGLYGARERFRIVAAADLVRALAGYALVLAGVPAVGAAAVFIAPPVADLISIGYYATRRESLGLRFDLDLSAARRYFRVGFPLGALAIVYWAYRYVGGLSVALGLSATAYGLYSFAAAPVAVAAGLVASLHTVLIPAVWGRAAVVEDRSWIAESERVTVLLAVLSGFAVNALQAGYAPAVHFLLPRFEASRPLVDVLALNVFLLSVAAIPSLVLSSTTVNQQGRYLLVWLAALALNVAANVVAIALGGGALAIAWIDIVVQAGMVVVIFLLAAPHLRPEGRTERLVARVGVLGAVCAAASLALHLQRFRGGGALSAGGAVAVRLALVTALWALVGAAAGGGRGVRGLLKRSSAATS